MVVVWLFFILSILAAVIGVAGMVASLVPKRKQPEPSGEFNFRKAWREAKAEVEGHDRVTGFVVYLGIVAIAALVGVSCAVTIWGNG
jgi:hypothetical protein